MCSEPHIPRQRDSCLTSNVRQKNMTTDNTKRHGCLTATLVFMLAVNSLTFLFYLFSREKIVAAFPEAPPWFVYVLTLACGFNIFLTISLFRWKKWAFYAFCIVASVIFSVNISLGVPPASAVAGLLGPAVIYGVLHIGGPNKGWSKLK